jgi:hypothetical protein
VPRLLDDWGDDFAALVSFGLGLIFILRIASTSAVASGFSEFFSVVGLWIDRQSIRLVGWRAEPCQFYYFSRIGMGVYYGRQLHLLTGCVNDSDDPSSLNDVNAPSVLNAVNAPSSLNDVNAPSLLNAVNAPSLLNAVIAPSLLNAGRALEKEPSFYVYEEAERHPRFPLYPVGPTLPLLLGQTFRDRCRFR